MSGIVQVNTGTGFEGNIDPPDLNSNIVSSCHELYNLWSSAFLHPGYHLCYLSFLSTNLVTALFVSDSFRNPGLSLWVLPEQTMCFFLPIASSLLRLSLHGTEIHLCQQTEITVKVYSFFPWIDFTPLTIPNLSFFNVKTTWKLFQILTANSLVKKKKENSGATNLTSHKYFRFHCHYPPTVESPLT